MKILAVGWLEDQVIYDNTITVPKIFLERLGIFLLNPMFISFSIDTCPICLEYATISTPNGKNLRIGSGEILIPGQNNVVYYSPDLILHHIMIHNYQPPQEFVNAILNAALPGTVEYEEFVKKVK